ncbi:chalcone-flavanone isomerase-domain-containing protein [Trametes punicea]|nr:chalcone-flavanone isomerase-domain-containing protein [Trametes punicea]
MNCIKARFVRTITQGCRSFSASTSSRLASRSNALTRAAVSHRKSYASSVLFWGSALAVATGLGLRSTVHLDTAATPSRVEEETRVDPATSIEFPKKLKIQSRTPLPTFTLMGVGVRTVSFLGIKVYSVGFYADLTDPILDIPKDATPEDKIEYIVRNRACVLRIIPTRSTSYGHLRDGFMRALQARQGLCKQRAQLTPDEELAIQSSLRKLKSMFPNTPLAKRSALDILVTAPSPKQQRTLIVRDLGSVQSDWLAREFVLAYFEGKGISPPVSACLFPTCLQGQRIRSYLFPVNS